MRTKSVGKKKINIVTLGCSKNIYDSEVLMGQLKANGKEVVHEQRGDIVVINTCGFIDNAKEESINTILQMGEYKTTGTCKYLIITGCLGQRYAEELLENIPEADAVIGTECYEDIAYVICHDKRFMQSL